MQAGRILEGYGQKQKALVLEIQTNLSKDNSALPYSPCCSPTFDATLA
jgi:hypothetical protein